MKARVKGTNNIIDVEFDKDAFNEGYPPYWEKESNMFYQPEQLEWVDNEENTDPDYLTRLERQYAGMAMNALLLTNNIRNGDLEGMRECNTNAMAIAHALVEKMKEERK